MEQALLLHNLEIPIPHYGPLRKQTLVYPTVLEWRPKQAMENKRKKAFLLNWNAQERAVQMYCQKLFLTVPPI